MGSTNKRAWMAVFFLAGTWRVQPVTAQTASSGLEEKINRLQQQMLERSLRLFDNGPEACYSTINILIMIFIFI